MNERAQKSILQMARGAIQERADYEMSRLLDNILDPNTAATAQRTLTITLKLKPDDTRQNIAVSCVAKSTLAATNPVTTSLYVADEETIVEMVPQIPGQTAIDGPDQEAPPMLKLIKTAGYSRFLACLLQCPGVADYSAFTVNGGTSAVSLAAEDAPVVGTVTIT